MEPLSFTGVNDNGGKSKSEVSAITISHLAAALTL